MSKWLMLATVAIMVGASVAHAGETVPADTNWSGFYLGVNGGYGTGQDDWTLKDNPGQGVSGSQGEIVAEPDVDGIIGGVQAGVNAQRGNLVFGFEGELAFSNIEGSESRTARGEKPGPREWSSEMNWMGTFGPRVGYAFSSTLLYVEGGIAAVNQDFYHLGASGSGGGHEGGEGNLQVAAVEEGREFDGEETHVGTFLGAGLEQSFTENLSARVEYSYFDIAGDAELWGKPKNPAVFDIDQSIHMFKLGLNYRFPM